ncbi:protein FAR1-RELATED SEQUENCE 5-like [Sesbania bispinosa]|nr:protein FAR1-RELATED SEQUENCE 5-like [Sesbania bispinosa]
MLPRHRKMSISEIYQMNHMLKVGIGPPHIYRSFALQAGCYQKIGFKKKNLYNHIHRQRSEQASNVVAALRYLREMRSRDPMMYFEHTVDRRPSFTAELKKFMMEDYDLAEFQQLWYKMVCRYHLEENQWVNALYEKRSMWATTHTREQMRFREKENDFVALHKDPVLQADFHNIEKCAAKYLTKEGLTCEYIIAVLGHLSILDLPRCLVLKRWSKGAKDCVQYYNGDGNNSWNASKPARGDDMMYLFSVLERLNNDTVDEYNKCHDKTLEAIAESRARKASVIGEGSSTGHGLESLRDPVRGRPKGMVREIHNLWYTSAKEEKML